jgi:hypothetical protein
MSYDNRTWLLNDARGLVENVVPIAERCGFGTAIGGSLAFKHASDNDLDLVFFPLKVSANYGERPPQTVYSGDHTLLLQALDQRLRIVVKGVVQFEDDRKLVYVAKLHPSFKKVDLFFPHLTFNDHLPNVKILIP